MTTIFLLIPLLLILVTVLYGIGQTMLRAWLDYRVRLAFLDKLEQNPALLGGKPDFGALLTGLTANTSGGQHQNYALTGLFLAVIGVACAVAGRLLRSGELAVGVYLGGVLCVVLGLVIALLGFAIRILTKPGSKASAKTS